MILVPRTLCTIGATVGLIALSACNTIRPVGPWRPAELTDSGELVVFQLQYPASYEEKVKPAVVPQEYALLVDWDEEPSRCHLLVFDRPRQRVLATQDFSQFLRALDDLPHGVAVGWVDTCCAPISHGMGAEREAQVRTVLAAGDRRLIPAADGDSGLLICTCESIRLRFPGEPVP